MKPTTESVKVELGFDRIARITGPDDLARALFPGSRNHQRIFLAIFLELKYAENSYLPSLGFITRKYDVSHRSLQRVRAKCRKLGLIDHVSRFNAKLGYREGWTLSTRFERSLQKLRDKVALLRKESDVKQQKQKDWDAINYA